MTCREKLKQEHPSKIDPKNAWGGCEGCPSDYNYLVNPDFCTDDSISDPDVRCAKCWDREIVGPLVQGVIDGIENPDPELTANIEKITKKILDSICKTPEAAEELVKTAENSRYICIGKPYLDGTEKIVDGRGKRATMGIIDEVCDTPYVENVGGNIDQCINCIFIEDYYGEKLCTKYDKKMDCHVTGCVEHIPWAALNDYECQLRKVGELDDNEHVSVKRFLEDREKLAEAFGYVPNVYAVSPEQLREALKWEHKGEPIAKANSEIDENGDLNITLLPYKPGAIGIGVSPTWDCTEPKIKDSGARREFETGAVRDIQEGKGRCDLLPLDVVSELRGQILKNIFNYQDTGDIKHLYIALQRFADRHYNQNISTMFLEVSKHFEEGAKKYGEYNWQKGIPTRCYIDSAVRHYLKYLRGDKDEPHDRAFVWNILCCIWTCIHKPELNDYKKKKDGKAFNPSLLDIETMARNTRLNEERKKQLDSKG